ncbi:hypothetical protein ACIDI_31c00020 [Acidiphilium sp. JA12-A1]|nr:hypothetical protein ACIDI_31c00020 [Acidiphilium sp. JA12-A1]
MRKARASGPGFPPFQGVRSEDLADLDLKEDVVLGAAAGLNVGRELGLGEDRRREERAGNDADAGEVVAVAGIERPQRIDFGYLAAEGFLEAEAEYLLNPVGGRWAVMLR